LGQAAFETDRMNEDVEVIDNSST